jgi:hypothetical protein
MHSVLKARTWVFLRAMYFLLYRFALLCPEEKMISTGLETSPGEVASAEHSAAGEESKTGQSNARRDPSVRHASLASG